MSTPITDAVAEKAFHEDGADDYEGYVVMLEHARRLELDRSELMGICDRLVQLNLNGTDDSLVRFIVAAHQNSATQALAEARANFPTP